MSKKKDNKITASSQWLAVRQLIMTIVKTVKLKHSLVFAFDNSDFSKPRAPDPEGLNWGYVEPAIIRFVGDASHPSILWPTLPFLTTTAFCNIGKENQDLNFLIPCSSLNEGKLSESSWDEKQDLVFWRGAPTGGVLHAYNPRVSLNRDFANQPGYDVAFSKGLFVLFCFVLGIKK